MRRSSTPLVCLALGAALSAFAAPAPAAPDPRAEQVASRLVAALGGEATFAKVRYVSFSFNGRRQHWWDRQTGRHRLEGTNREGQSYLVLANVNDGGKGAGQAFLAGAEVTGEEKAKLLENAYSAWINDFYWLLVPFKLHDPGVSLAYEGEETVDGALCDKIKMTFDHVGLTPGDTYWLLVDRASGLLARWEYVLEGQQPPATAWRWQAWERYGPGVLLSGERVLLDGSRKLTLEKISLPDSLPDSVFTATAPIATP